MSNLLSKFKIFNQYRGLRHENYILFFGRVVTCMGSMVWPMLTLILDKKLGMSAGDIALLFMIEGLACMPVSLYGGRLADRVNKKKIIIVGDLVSVICFIICGIIPLSFITVGLFMFASIFQSIEGPAYDALVADISPTKDREKAFSLLYLGGNLGLMLAPTLGGILFKNYLWLSFIISGVAIGISTLLIALFVRDIEPVEEECEEAVYQKARENESVWRILFENKAVLLFTVIMALYFAAYNQFSFLMPLEMGRIHGDDGALIFGTVNSLNCVICVVFTPLITTIFKRLCETGKMVLGIALTIIGYTLFIVLRGFVPIYYVAMVIFTWGEIFNTLAEGPYGTKRIPSSHRGRLMSIIGVGQGILVSLFDLVVGKMYDFTGPIGAWTVVMSAAGISHVMAIILVRIDRKHYPKLYLEENEETADNETAG